MNNEDYIISLREHSLDGNVEAMEDLATIYERGLHGVMPDLEVANYWRKAAKILREGNKSRPELHQKPEDTIDTEEAKENAWQGFDELKNVPLLRLRQVAESGNPYALVLLGKQYIVTDKSSNYYQADQGAAMIEEAINIGKTSVAVYRDLLAEAYWRLGMYYESKANRGDNELYSKSFECYSLVVQELEDERAVDDLARCYEQGIGCDVNLEKAQMLLEKSAMSKGIWERLSVAEVYFARDQHIQAAIWYQAGLESIDAEDNNTAVSVCRYRLALLGEVDAKGNRYSVEEENVHLQLMAQQHDSYAAWFYANYIADTENDKAYYLELGQGHLPHRYAVLCSHELGEILARQEVRRQEEEERQQELREEREAEDEYSREKAKMLLFSLAMLGVIVITVIIVRGSY